MCKNSQPLDTIHKFRATLRFTYNNLSPFTLIYSWTTSCQVEAGFKGFNCVRQDHKHHYASVIINHYVKFPINTVFPLTLQDLHVT